MDLAAAMALDSFETSNGATRMVNMPDLFPKTTSVRYLSPTKTNFSHGEFVSPLLLLLSFLL